MDAKLLQNIKQRAVPIAIEFGVDKLALFGSYARGQQHEYSDMDFLIEKGKIEDMFQLCAFCDRLEDEFELKVDLLTYDSLKRSLISEAINDEVVLYERQR